ncbi:hypothetical protein HPP92_019406 [Vanilla planifolia]|uniref:ABC transporter domain-containing protein n=1 Tax=Vanilla planifolia TaxID=51239 RepID=A0A835Q5L8_VANPL|nr:hypothetical protein HPP92_019406 [Vanilla planifolia]
MSEMSSSRRQLTAMLHKNWLLKTRHPFTTLAEILMPMIVMMLLMGVRTRVDTQVHPVQAYVRKGMFVEVGKSEVSPSIENLLEFILARNEHLAFVPDTSETRKMFGLLCWRYPLLQLVGRIYEDELALETYIRSDVYGSHDSMRFSPKPDSGRIYPKNIRIVPFPTREYTDDEFESIVKAVMGVLYLLGFLFPVSRLISYSAFEKEQKIKEGLQMMGLKSVIFYLSWFITYLLQFAISSAIITASTMNSLFLYSDKSLVFVYFFSFSLSAIMLSFLISTFFNRAKTAVAVGTLSFLGAFLPYYSVNDPAVPMLWKILASLLSPAAFALGTVNFADYERAHVGVRWTNMWQASSGVNFLICLLMMLLDTIIYCAFGLYFEKVPSQESGGCYLWNALFTNIAQMKKMPFHHFNLPVGTYEKLPHEGSQHVGEEPFVRAFEPISMEMKQFEIDGRCIKLRNLHKVYVSKKGKFCAVNYLNLSLYENQIVALLGHNGAGKSTTISMLVGLLPPTSGDALVFGKNIITEMDEIRKNLGVCPQHDILFPELTVKEHLLMFAVLKGVDRHCLESKVTEMVNEVGLADKVNSVVGTLSGGMKRKLSVGIALIGNSKTSPGSTVGAEIVNHHVPMAECFSDVGSEVSFRLPATSSSLFANMFREIESHIRRSGANSGSSFAKADYAIESYGISVTTLEEVFLKVAGQSMHYDDPEQCDNEAAQVSHGALLRLSASKDAF